MRQYYQFAAHLDVDRYDIDGVTQDTVIAVRELNQKADDTWYNNTLVFTHGYGVVAAYGNQRDAQGQPEFLESGIPSAGSLGEFEPRIYFGESSPEYSIVGAAEGAEKDIEIDYPSDSGSAGTDDDSAAGNAKTTFVGDGGPKLDNLFTRLVYAIKFQSQDILLSGAVTDDSQILYDRSPIDRVQEVAPVPDPRQRRLPGGRRRPRAVDRRRVHDDGELPVLAHPVAVGRDRRHQHGRCGRTRSTTSTTSATR